MQGLENGGPLQGKRAHYGVKAVTHGVEVP